MLTLATDILVTAMNFTVTALTLNALHPLVGK